MLLSSQHPIEWISVYPLFFLLEALCTVGVSLNIPQSSKACALVLNKVISLLSSRLDGARVVHIKDVPYCSQYKNDNQILSSLGRGIARNPNDESPTKTYALLDKNHRVYQLNIAKGPFNFSTLPCLKHLKQLFIRNANVSALQHLPSSLEELNIYDTPINHLLDRIGQLHRLKSLKLNNVGLLTIPMSFADLNSLGSLSLSGNDLKSLPSFIASMTSLSYINLDDNPLLKSLQSLNGHRSLKYLLARNCSIEGLPLNLTSLIDLYLSNNRLSNLDGIHTLGNDNTSKSFYFNGNEIESIATEIGQLKNVERLHLDNNALTHLPRNIMSIQPMTHLSIRNHRFSDGELTAIVWSFMMTHPNSTIVW